MPFLNDSVVLLTGGATGIGRAIALDMAAAGAIVAIGDTNIDDGQRTVEEILSAGGKASFRSCDVAEAEQVTALVNGAVADFGQLDVLVNDAGISGGSRRLHELDIDAWDRTIAVNLRGTFLCARAAIPHLLRRPRSAMINIASTYGLIGAPMAPSYCASKGGSSPSPGSWPSTTAATACASTPSAPATPTPTWAAEGQPCRRPNAPPRRRGGKRAPPCSPSAAGAAPGSGPCRDVPGLGRGVLHDRFHRDRRRRMHGHLPLWIMTVPRTPARADSHNSPSAQPCPAWPPSQPDREDCSDLPVIDTGGQALARRRPPTGRYAHV